MANDTRTRMLDATARLLRQRGYHGTSLNDILVIEVTRASVAAVAERLRDTLATETRPGEAIRKIFAVTAQMLDENFAMGCPVAPVVLDGTNEIPEHVELTRRAFDEWIGLFQEAFARTGISDKRARTLALLVESSIEGLMIIARATRDSSVLLGVADELAALVEAAARNTGRQAKKQK